jgi:hypothetical protein
MEEAKIIVFATGRVQRPSMIRSLIENTVGLPIKY